MATATSKRSSDPHSRRELLLHVAEQQFGEKGFDGASIRDIADASKVNIGSIYNFFSDKRGLEIAVLERVYSRLYDYAARTALTEGEPVENLKRFMGSLVLFMQEHPMAHRVLIQEVLAGSLGVDDEIRSHIRRTRRIANDILYDGQRRGVFRTVDNEAFTFGLLNATISFFMAKTLFGKLVGEIRPPEDIFREHLPFPLFESVMEGLLIKKPWASPRGVTAIASRP